MILTRSQSQINLNPVLYLAGLIKFLTFVSLMILFIIHHTIAGLVIWSEELKLKYFLRSISLTSKICLRILNIKVSREGAGGEVTQRLIVANHLSYLDVLILFSHHPALFITSVEIRETFMLGRVCKLAGCFFVERRKDYRTENTKMIELELMKEKFSQGHNIFLFPEGTSSDGSTVLPFKNTFFQLAVDTKTHVVPMCLKYTGNNAAISPWFGDMTFVDHLFKVCLQKEITADLIVLSEISGNDRVHLAQQAQELISGAYAKH